MLDLLNTLFAQPAPVQLCAFIGYALFVLGLSLLLLFFIRQECAGLAAITPHPPYFAAITSIFALFLTFQASDIWHGKSRALQNFYHLGSLYGALASATRDGDPALRNAQPYVARYLAATVKEEWLEYNNSKQTAAARTALDDLQNYLMNPRNAVAPASAAIVNGMVNEIRKARAEEFAIAADEMGEITWVTLFTLGMLSHFAIVMIHVEKPKAAIVGLILFASASTVAFWSLGVGTNPYRYLAEFPVEDWLAYMK